MRAIAIPILLALASHCAAAEPDLTGNWTGAWLDTRPNTGNSGGPLWAAAVAHEQPRENAPAKVKEWKVTFRISKDKTYEVLFKPKPKAPDPLAAENPPAAPKREGEPTLTFGGYANAGDARGLYYWTATLEKNELKGTYEGPDEKGTFTLKKDPQKK